MPEQQAKLPPIELRRITYKSEDYVASKLLPENRFGGVMPLLWGYANLVLGNVEECSQFIDVWQYATVDAAIVALALWYIEATPEPGGWVVHQSSGRRRPNGDKTREYISE